MIQAKELRVGNLVYAFQEVASVNCISNEGLSLISDENQYVFEPFEYVYPIALTEEWLLRFGFEYSGEHREYYHPSTPLLNLYNRTGLENGFKIIAGRYHAGIVLQISEEIKSVHELQNIWHSLTRTELEIK